MMKLIKLNLPSNSKTFIKSITCGMVFFLAANSTVFAQASKFQHSPDEVSRGVIEAWVARDGGLGNGPDSATALAIDSNGNVYVTGKTFGLRTKDDYTTIKYNSAGVVQWKKFYGGPGNRNDVATAIAVDEVGNVYVTGRSAGAGTSDDYATIKYNSFGDTLWARRYGGPGNRNDAATAIAVDNAGNVYVTGWSVGDGTQEDYATIKYNSSGMKLWEARYGGPGNRHDVASAIAVDNAGNVYVTGWSVGDGTQEDYATIKYNSSGMKLWEARYGGPANGPDFATAMVLDAAGNIYVTGKSKGSNVMRLPSLQQDDHDYATIKYDASGTKKWEARYGGPENGPDYATAIAVDPAGNVYVTGKTVGAGTKDDYATIKYNASGKQQWVEYYGGPGNGDDFANAIAVDRSGNVYVTGRSVGIGTQDDYATIKYTPSGAKEWEIRYGGPGNRDDVANAIAIDGAGNVYVTGRSVGDGTDDDYATIKYIEGATPLAITNPAVVLNSTSATLHGIVNPNGLSTAVKFEYGLSIRYGREVAATQNSVGGTSSMAVMATLRELSPGTPYHYRVVATNEAGTTTGNDQLFITYPSDYPQTLQINLSLNFPSYSTASEYQAADYQIVGLPGASNRSVKDFLPGAQNVNWQIFWDSGAANNFFAAFDGSPNFQFSVGRAFWIIHKGPLNINTTVPSAPFNAVQEFEIPLHSGWNLITNPFTSPVMWSKIQSVNNVTEPIWAFNGSFNRPLSFEPHVGYYFFNDPGNQKDMLKIPYRLFSSALLADRDLHAADWQVNIALTSGAFSDKSTSFGIARKASPGLDHLDFRKPRAIATTPNVSFHRPAWDASYSTFATDIRPEFEDSESWEFEVRSSPQIPAQLAFSGITRIPSHFEVYLIDKGRARTVNLREDSLYQFTPAAELSKFSVVVGKKEAVQEKLSSVALPKEFALGPNYPNPFNPTTTIPVAVPVASEIKLKIYNLLGAEVKTIYDGTIEAGRYWFNWDGRNEAGTNVATGVYLYRLSTSAGVTLLGKMILVR